MRPAVFCRPNARWLSMAALALASASAAAPLSLYELDAVPMALACRDACGTLPAIDRDTCGSACSPAVQPTWERNGVAPVDRMDWMLAILEYWDDNSGSLACVKDGVVKPIALCGGAVACEVAHKQPGDCVDEDGDGLSGWEERAIGTDPKVKQTACTANAQCDFATECDFKFELGRSYCAPRACAASGGCTAFHLEQVATNKQEVILQVSFDYSPTPATVLDLRVLYTATDLVLLDARPLPLLSASNKGVSVTHPAAGVLRLVVLGNATTEPVPNGRIIELVFQRVTTQPTTVRFDSSPIYRRNSMAPSQGAAQAALAQDSLWGAAISLGGTSDAAAPRLVLAYSFDSLSKPQEYSNVPSAEDLCAWMGPVACPPSTAVTDVEKRLRTKTLAALGLLQSGSMAAKTLIDGVNGKAVYFDGTWDHLDLPVALNAGPSTPLTVASQSSSLSTWLLPEGPSADEGPGSYQVVWSHQRADDESARYGVRLDVNQLDSSKVDLSWFDDGRTDAQGRPLVMSFAVGLALHKWVHLGLSFDPKPSENAPAGVVRFFVDGQSKGSVALAAAPALSCPVLGTDSVREPPIALHTPGDNGTSPGELIYLSTPQNGLFGVDRMDPTGFGLSSVVRPTDATVQDPDYSPLVDKVLYSSNKSGSAEIWIANGDGSNPQQVTTGFGDAVNGVFARRPRWAPDASGLIFESNAFHVAKGDNAPRVYHLYYVAYDATPGAAPPTLNYQALALKDSLYTNRLTAGAWQHTGVAWLKGKGTVPSPSGSGTDAVLGEIAYSKADPLYRAFTVEQLTIRAPLTATPQSPGEVRIPGSAADFESSVRLLAAKGRQVNGEDRSRMLLQYERTLFVPSSNYSLVDSTTSGETTTVRVIHTPPSNTSPESLPANIPGLYLAYDEAVTSVDLQGSHGGTGLKASGPGEADKTIDILDVGFTSPGKSLRFVKLSVNGSTSQRIVPGAEIAVIRFVGRKDGKDLGLALKDRVVNRSLYVVDRARKDSPLQFAVRSDLMEEVDQAAFSPDASQLVLSGVSRARPTLLRGKLVEPQASGGTYSLSDEVVLSSAPTRVEGISWTRVERFTPCHRVAATRNPTSGLYGNAFRGGIDELKVYSYVRDPGAFLSDAQRGHEWLRAAGRDGVLPAIQPTCTGLDTECPPYMVCNAQTNRCERMACNPGAVDSCKGHGLCSYRPLSVESETSGFDWLCSSECNADSQCFQRDCLNGPCRFCTAGACNECNVVEKNYGSFKAVETVGCPDSNGWACEYGNCVSQCYRIANGVSKYLCNPTEEYCLRGKCTPMQWDWSELGPSSLSSLGEMKVVPLKSWIATEQKVPIDIQAWGVEDYAHSPELLVEGRIGGSAEGFLATWFPIGRILVYNRTQAEAQEKPYRLVTEYPITELRLRLVTPPLENFGGASTGYGFPGDKVHRAAGSQFALGYALNLPTWASYVACDANPTEWGSCANRLSADPFRAYLRGGQPAAMVLDVRVNGMGVLMNTQTKNRICSYQGSSTPAALGEPQKKVFFGSIGLEDSNERHIFCKAGVDCSGGTQEAVVSFDARSKGAALLNCNYYDPQSPGESAGLEMSFSAPIFTAPGDTVENDNSCLVTEVVDEKIVRRPCFEIADGDAAIDVMNASQVLDNKFGLLDFELFRFFAWPMPVGGSEAGGAP